MLNYHSKDTTGESLVLKKIGSSELISPLELTGEFRVWKNTSGEVVFYTETENNIFLFSCVECNIDLNKINSSEEGVLTYLDHAFIFKNKNGSFYFAVDKPEEKSIKSLLSLNFKGEREAYGIAIVKSYFSKEIKNQYPNFSSDVFKSSKLSEYFVIISNTVGSDCQSGGWGSDSCSLGNGGCSVSCINGYYACCNAGNCECIERKGTKPIGTER
ncbi:MAG: hypothetical protein H3C39_05200 [Flavobacteriia bacterium]|nr:hypothetical protein [Flavobacteriia bacterium]